LSDVAHLTQSSRFGKGPSPFVAGWPLRFAGKPSPFAAGWPLRFAAGWPAGKPSPSRGPLTETTEGRGAAVRRTPVPRVVRFVYFTRASNVAVPKGVLSGIAEGENVEA
jgi:hypothetical protein